MEAANVLTFIALPDLILTSAVLLNFHFVMRFRTVKLHAEIFYGLSLLCKSHLDEPMVAEC